MTARRWLLCLLLGGCCATPAKPPTRPSSEHNHALAVDFQNDLAACVSFTPQRTEVMGDVIMLHATMRVAQSIGACGCKSSVVGYRVRRVDHPVSNMDIVGRMNTLSRQGKPAESVIVVLATDASMFKTAHGATVQVTCTDPD